MYTPIPANTPAPAAPTSSMTSNSSSASNANTTSSSGINPRNRASGTPSNERARPASGISSFLNTFGIRQNSQTASSSAAPDQRLFGTTPSNSHMSVAMESIDTAPQQQEPHLHHPIQMPLSAQFHVHRNYQLPISISLTAPTTTDHQQLSAHNFEGNNVGNVQESLNQRQPNGTNNTTTSIISICQRLQREI